MTREEAARVLTELADEYEKHELSENGWLETTYIPAHRMGAAALREPEWVRTADKLPLYFSNILVVMGGKLTLGLYVCHGWFFYNEDKNKWEMDEYDRVTHWMPVPKLPEVEG